MASIVVLGPCRHSASLVAAGHRLHEVIEVAAVAGRPCDLVIAADGALDDAAWALLCAPGAPPVVLLQSTSAHRSGAFDTLAPDAEAARVRAVVERAQRYRQACRDRDAARADHDAVLGALRFLVDDAAHLVHDVKTPGTAIRQALRAVGRHLKVDEDGLLCEFGDELERVEGLLRAVLRLVQPLPPAAAPASLAEVFAAVRATCGDAGGAGTPLALRLEPTSLVVPGRAEDWVTALCGALKQAAAGRIDAPLELVGQGSPGLVCVEIRHCGDVAEPPPRSLASADGGVGMAFCRRLVAEFQGRLEMSATVVAGGAVCRIELPAP